jgi:hypothetical protein
VNDYGFGLPRQTIFQLSAMFRRQPLNAFKDFVDSLTHSNTWKPTANNRDQSAMGNSVILPARQPAG